MKNLKEVKLVMIPYEAEKLEIGQYIKHKTLGQLKQIINMDEYDHPDNFSENNWDFVKPYIVCYDEPSHGDNYGLFLINDKIVKMRDSDELHGYMYHNDDIPLFKVIVQPDQISIYQYSEPLYNRLSLKDFQKILDNDGKCFIELDSAVILNSENSVVNPNFNKPQLINGKVIIYLNYENNTNFNRLRNQRDVCKIF